MSKFGIQGIDLNNVQFGGVAGYAVERGLQIESGSLDGSKYQTMHSILQVKSSAELTTQALKTWLTPSTGPLAGSTDLPYVALDGTHGLKMYGAKSDSAGPGYASGSVHRMLQGLRGCLYATSIKWSLGSYAELGLRALFKSSDGAAAVLGDSLVALPTQLVPVEKFVLSALTLGANATTNINDIDIAIDGKFEQLFSTGLPYPTDIAGAGVMGPLAVMLSANVGDLDVGEGTGACSAVFTNAAQGATLGSSIVTVTLNSAWSIEEGRTTPNGSPIGRRLVVRTRYDGANLPMVITVA